MKEWFRNLWNIIWKKFLVGAGGSIALTILLTIAFIGEIVAVIADFCPKDYCCGVEKLVSYDKSNVVSIMAIAWSAVSIPLGFLLGQIEHRIYGIRLVNFLIAKLGIVWSALLVITFFIQLGFIVIASAYELPVTLTVVTWTQILYVVFFFYLVLISVSHDAVHNVVSTQSKKICKKIKSQNDELKKELENKKLSEQAELMLKFPSATAVGHWLLTDMVKNIDYNKMEDLENLKRILIETVCFDLRGRVGRKIVFDLFQNMLLADGKEGIKRVTTDVFLANTSMDVKKGILGALLSERRHDFYTYCTFLTEKLGRSQIGREDVGDILFWEILWCIHQRMMELDPVEALENDIFIDDLQKLAEALGLNNIKYDEGRYDGIVLQSCQDFMMLQQLGIADEIIANLYERKM